MTYSNSQRPIDFCLSKKRGKSRMYCLFESLGFDTEGRERRIYSLFTSRIGRVNSCAMVFDFAAEGQKARRIFKMISENEVEPEYVRDILEDIND